MGTRHTGIPLLAYGNVQINVSKTINGVEGDNTAFNIIIRQSDGVIIAWGWVRANRPMVVKGLPDGTYTVEENSLTGYSLVSITPSAFTIDKNNRIIDIQVINQVEGYSDVYGLLYNAHAVNKVGVKYGRLFNEFAIDSVKGFAPAGWHVATAAEWATLIESLGGTFVDDHYDGGVNYKLSQSGTTYWTSDSGTDDEGFMSRGGGRRDSEGFFAEINQTAAFWADGGYLEWSFSDANIYTTSPGSNVGAYVRYVKDDSVDTGTMVGNDGTVYPTVKIGDQVWTRVNSIETLYADSDPIPRITDGATWVNDTDGARCEYSNDEEYVSANIFGIEGWHVPTESELDTLGGIIAEDTSVLQFQGVGLRTIIGVFSPTPEDCFLWGENMEPTRNMYCWFGISQGYVNAYQQSSGANFTAGFFIRLVKDDDIYVSSVQDIDGNYYTTNMIAGKIWIMQNFNCKHFLDGSPIAHKPDAGDWIADTDGAWCYYDDPEA